MLEKFGIGVIAAASLLAPRSSAQDEQPPAWTAFVPANSDNVLHIGDLYTHIESALSSKRLRDFAGSYDQGRYAVQSVGALMGMFRQYVPTEVAFGVSSTTVASFANFLHASDLLSIMTAVDMVDVDEAHRERMIDEFLALLDRPLGLHFAGCVKTRTGRTAENWYEQLAETLDEAAAEFDFALEETDDRLRFSIRFADLMDEDELADYALYLLGLERDDARFGKLAERFLAVGVTVSIELLEDGLRLVVGDPGPLGFAAPVVRRQNAKRPDVLVEWSNRTLIEALRPVVASWDHWKTTPLGRAAVEEDTEDTLGMTVRILESLETMPLRGSFACWMGAGGVEFDLVERAGEAMRVEGIADIARLLPTDAEVRYVDGCRSFAEAARGLLLSFEDRLATRELQADVRGQEDRVALFGQASRIYYEKFGRVRELLLDGGQDAFEPPYAWIAVSRGTTELQHPDDPAVVLADVPVPGFAFVTRIRSRDAALTYLHSFGRHLDESLDTMTRSLDDALVDLGLDRPTWAVPNVDRWVRGDLTPHAFVHGDFLVWSTSRDLSTRILAAASAEKGAPDRHCVGSFETSGAGIASFVEQFGETMSALSGGRDARLVQPEFAQVADLTTGLCGLLGRIHSRTTWKGDEVLTVGAIEFADD
ncbi:MAG: hypothetical protein KDB80_16185 [Planctomycetes bacterium]|nr:hypothetical protein [Planctomycetota bacterium]